MKELDMNVNLRLYGRVTNLIIRSQRMKQLVIINVTYANIKLHNIVMLMFIKNQSMKELEMVLTNVNIKLHNIVV